MATVTVVSGKANPIEWIIRSNGVPLSSSDLTAIIRMELKLGTYLVNSAVDDVFDWTSQEIEVDGVITKVLQIQLGLVSDLPKQIFWNPLLFTYTAAEPEGRWYRFFESIIVQ